MCVRCCLFVCLKIFVLFKENFFFFRTLGNAWTFQELQGAKTCFRLPVKGVSSLKGNSLFLKKKNRICKKKEKLAKNISSRGTEKEEWLGSSARPLQADRLADLSLKLHIFY